MSISDWLGPALYGAAAGAVVLAVAGFSWGGWVTGGTSQRMADAQSGAAVATALVPLCLERARTDPAGAAKTAALQAAKTYERQDLMMKSGWATPPGSDTADLALARACLPALALAP